MNLSETTTKAIKAYGGLELWQNAKQIKATVSAKGLAFTLKRRPAFVRASIEMSIDRAFSKLTPIGKAKDIVGVLDATNVRLEKLDGTILKQRENPRKYFPYGRRLFYWDDLDMAYFANYAFWNYLTLPRLLMNEEIEWTEKSEGFLIAKFPKSIPTHNEIQEFHFDSDTGLLKQHNYTAEIISGLATAANLVTEHKTMDNITFASSRRVTPKRSNGVALHSPILIGIKVHNYEIL